MATAVRGTCGKLELQRAGGVTEPAARPTPWGSHVDVQPVDWLSQRLQPHSHMSSRQLNHGSCRVQLVTQLAIGLLSVPPPLYQ